VAVSAGSSRTFSFSAAAGAYVGEVIVDGVHLTQAQIDAGSYTFYNVTTSHTIQVLSRDPRTDITLRIDTAEGKGYVEYSISDGDFVRYSGTVILPEFSSLEIRAYADNGYRFDRWVEGTAVQTAETISFADVGSSIQLSVYFAEDNGFPWWALALIVLLLLFFLFLLLFFLRKKYEVIKIEITGKIIGENKARRKRPYAFIITGGSGAVTVTYSIGEGGVKKTLLPGSGGEYVIPKGVITDKVTIECR
jgi:hypothetical protein